jgi:hypothetical protein
MQLFIVAVALAEIRGKTTLGARKDKSFLVLFFKKEQEKQTLLFEKRSKNFCLFGSVPGGGVALQAGGGKDARVAEGVAWLR